MKTQKTARINPHAIIAVLAAILIVLVAVISIIEIPKATSKEDVVVVETTRFEEAGSFTIDKMEMTTYVDNGVEVHNYYVSLKNEHVVFMAEVNLDQYICRNIGDAIPGTLIAEGNNMKFELDEFGKSFTVLGYVLSVHLMQKHLNLP